MKYTQASLFAIGLLSLLCIGCGKSGPDPKANPNFQEKTLSDPGAVKMGEGMPKGGPGQ
jgi:hypothetical protein